jgi:8-oxo-dGTP pyrophosphatase MutT (NUDIX family)
MAHIHNEPGQHDQTASAYIIFLGGPEPCIAMHRHKILGQYLQFGGHVELHETQWAAVVHEIREESGYNLNQLKLLQPHKRISHAEDAVVHPLPFYLNSHRFAGGEHFHTDAGFAFVTHQLPRHAVGKDESGELRFFTRAELMKLSHNAIPANVRNAILFILDHLLKDWEAVDPALYHVSYPKGLT